MNRTADDHAAWVRNGAERYVAVAFRGRGKYDRVDAATIEEAREAARSLKTDRPAMIYAVRGFHQVHVENV